MKTSSRSAWFFLLAFAAACGGASSSPSTGPGAERAGDGSQAYRKIAEALCDRQASCIEEAHSLRYFATHEACVDQEVRELSLFGKTSCDEATDYKVDAGDLARCIDGLLALPCTQLITGYSLLASARLGLFEGCGAAAETLAKAEGARLWSDKRATGESCRYDDDCDWDAYCTTDGTASCGECRPYPAAGEPCYYDENSEAYLCQQGALCTRDLKCVDRPPNAGETCAAGGGSDCAAGLDCNDQDKCAKLHTEGDDCSPEDGSPCGDWLVCAAGKCVSGVPFLAQEGGACADGDQNPCGYGRCIDGTCRELPDLGEACDDTCLKPYACVDGTCQDVPACQAGAAGSVCSQDFQCEPGLRCEYGAGDVRSCTQRFGEVGEACWTDGRCDWGRCVDGVCTLQKNGATCASGDECTSGHCEGDRCVTVADVCE